MVVAWHTGSGLQRQLELLQLKPSPAMFQQQTALAKVRPVGCTAVTFVPLPLLTLPPSLLTLPPPPFSLSPLLTLPPSLTPPSPPTHTQLLGEYASDLGSASVQIACEYGLQIAGWEAVLKNCSNIVRWVNHGVVC